MTQHQWKRLFWALMVLWTQEEWIGFHPAVAIIEVER